MEGGDEKGRKKEPDRRLPLLQCHPTKSLSVQHLPLANLDAQRATAGKKAAVELKITYQKKDMSNTQFWKDRCKRKRTAKAFPF